MNDCIAHKFGCGCQGKCRSDIMPSKAAISRWPERLDLINFVLLAALCIWVGGEAMERVERGCPSFNEVVEHG